MGKSWCVVEFNDGVQIVPQIWIEGDKCYWPTTLKSANSQKLFEKWVKDYKQPEKFWELYAVRILGVYDSYELAIPKLKLAESQSDLNTDEETWKKSRSSRRKKILSSDEDDIESDDDIAVKAYPKVPNKMPLQESSPEGSSRKDYLTPKINKKPKIKAPSSESGTQESKIGDELLAVKRRQPVDQFENSLKNCSFSNDQAIQATEDCCRCCCQFDKEYKRKIERDLNEVKNELKLVLQILREQGRPLAPVCEPSDDGEDYEQGLPMKTEENVASWERRLSLKEEQKKMISFLARIGGHEINAIVKNILRKLFTDSLSSLYNWEGKKGKRMFSSLILSDCIKKAALLSPNSSATATEQDIIKAVKNWLRHASARSGNIKKNMGTDENLKE